MTGLTDFQGRVAVVTGGASGIGKALAKAFVVEGAQVVVADVEGEALDLAAGEIGAVSHPLRREPGGLGPGAGRCGDAVLRAGGRGLQ